MSAGKGRVLELAGLRVGGLSIGGAETFLDLPDFKLAFDVGRCPPAAIRRKTILFTHCHVDHMGGVAYHAATRALRNMEPPTYVVPRTEVEAFEALFAAWRRLDRSELPHETVPLAPGEELELRPDLVVRPFRALHTAPCQGYAVVQKRHKLRAEYTGLPGPEIGALRKEGVAVTEERESVEVAFCGDTRIEVVEREELVRRARLLILETTFVDERVSVDEARAMGHVHLDEVVERAAELRNEALLLTHFSPRYRRAEIRAALDARLPAELLARTTPLLEGFP